MTYDYLGFDINDVDEAIRPLVVAMNDRQLGIQTRYSCEGHPELIHKNGHGYPYVSFNCTTELAEKIATKLHNTKTQGGMFNYSWVVIGCFSKEKNQENKDDSLKLSYGLYAPDLQFKWKKSILSRFYHKSRRLSLNEDFDMLENLIKSL